MTIPSIICTESLTRHDHYDTHHHHLQPDDYDNQHVQQNDHDNQHAQQDDPDDHHLQQDDHDDQHAQQDDHDDHPQHDLHRKPQGTIALHESCRVSRAEGSNTFEIATNGDHHDNGHDDEVDDDIDYDDEDCVDDGNNTIKIATTERKKETSYKFIHIFFY